MPGQFVQPPQGSMPLLMPGQEQTQIHQQQPIAAGEPVLDYQTDVMHYEGQEDGIATGIPYQQ